MELLQLRYFYESSQNENFAKTAEKFMVPASSVSASVKRLEKELGVNLFNRTSNKITLNEKGYILSEALGEIFEKLDFAVSEITEKQQEKIELYILIRARRKWITDLIIEYKKNHPDVHFRIFNDFDVSDFSGFDIIIDEQADIYNELERFLLSVEQICIKASKNSPLVGKKLLFRQLREYPFIMTRKGNAMRRLLESAGKRNGFVPDVAVECNDYICMTKYVEAGMGLTLGSYRALDDNTSKNIVPLDVTDFSEVQSVYVYHRKFKAKDNALKDFCEFLKQKEQN